jgi:hypothetical protein
MPWPSGARESAKSRAGDRTHGRSGKDAVPKRRPDRFTRPSVPITLPMANFLKVQPFTRNPSSLSRKWNQFRNGGTKYGMHSANDPESQAVQLPGT